MKNGRVIWLLSCQNDQTGQPLTIATLARRIGSSYAHVNRVLANAPGRGHQTRRKLAPLLSEPVLRELGWDKSGALVPRETCQ